jgi:ribosomal protein S18 acetylase RimI-like enzyme
MTIEPDVHIRPGLPADVVAIRALTRAAYAKWVPLIGREPLPMAADYDRALLEHAFDLLLADGRLVGLIETKVEPDHLWIENVAVAPKEQGKGWGRRLLAHAERKAQAANLAELRLLTNPAFQGNVRLYQAIGYTITRTEPFRGGTTVYMGKRVSP